MKKDGIVTLAIMLIVVLLLASAVWYVSSKNKTSKTIPTPAERSLSSAGYAPYTDLDGNQVLLTDFLGRTLVVTVWASWCPECRTDLTLFNRISQNYDLEEVVFLAINRAEPKATARAFLDTFKLAGDVIYILDPDDHFYHSTDSFSMPETIIFSPNGNEVYRKRGRINASELQGKLQENTGN
ncbi:MAG: TlpA family protein disulfide reductase [Candidatus Kaiserbacteria bacterium]|nr:TlpA family protein disulfide reductase [Candidatus Kaiserbacteria bacterium]MCB9815953.1 TlpA family protein disulfide reductase [Candidatus Nomurabacteria bacterium]